MVFIGRKSKKVPIFYVELAFVSGVTLTQKPHKSVVSFMDPPLLRCVTSWDLHDWDWKWQTW